MSKFVSLGVRVGVACAIAAPAVAQPSWGVGGGGALMTGVFDPNDDDTIVVGGDNSGIFRTDDYGTTWTLWTDGLSTKDEARSVYVQDIVHTPPNTVVENGYFAATRAGIYWRGADVNSAAWELVTVPEPGLDRVKNGKSEPMPFSALDVMDHFLVAGAGIIRHFSGNPSDEAISTTSDERHALWFIQMNSAIQGSPSIIPFPGTDDAQHFPLVRDVAVEATPGGTVFAAATSVGLHVYGSGGWVHGVQPIDVDPTHCWTVEVTPRGTLYATFQGERDSTGTLISPGGVWKVADVTTGAPYSWERVDEAALECGPPPGCTPVSELPAQVKLSVFPGTGSAPDILYLGGAGLFRTELDGTLPVDPNLEWRRWLFAQGGGLRFSRSDGEDAACTGQDACSPTRPNGTTTVLDEGWATDFGAAVTAWPIVSPTNADRVAVQMDSRFHVYKPDTFEPGEQITPGNDDQWVQRYTLSNGAGGWRTRGYSQNSVREIVFDDDGHIVHNGVDYGVFRSAAIRQEHERLNPPTIPNCANIRSRHLGADDGRIYVAYGGQNRFSHLQEYDPVLGTWTDVTPPTNWTPGWDSKRIAFDDFTFVGAGDIVVLYTEYNQIVGPGGDCPGVPASDANVVTNGVLRGARQPDGTWNWQFWDDALDTFTGTGDRPRGDTVHVDEATSTVVLAAARSNVGSVSVPGGLFYRGVNDTEWTAIFDHQTDVAPSNSPYVADVREIAQSFDGDVFYIGTSGRRATSDHGAILKCSVSLDPLAYRNPANWTLLTDGNPFGFEVPYGESWADGTEAATWLLDVRALVVDPFDNDTVYAGLFNNETIHQEGVWTFKSGSWLRHSADDDLVGMGVFDLAIEVETQSRARLYIGTQGLGLRSRMIFEPSGPGGVGGPGCPFVFVYDGSEFVRDNSVLDVVPRGLAGQERANVSDAYVLTRTPAVVDDEIRLEIREFENEHSFIDRVGLRVVSHPIDSELVVDAAGRVRTVETSLAPVRSSGGDAAIQALAARDGRRFEGKAGDSLTLTYAIPDGTGTISASLTGDPKNPEEPLRVGTAGRGIELTALGPDGDRHAIGNIVPREHPSPEAIAMHVRDVERCRVDGKLTIELRWHSDHALDDARLVVPSLDAPTIVDVPLLVAEHVTRGDRLRALAAEDGLVAELVPGETLVLRFDASAIPRRTATREPSYVLDLDGHYVRIDAVDGPAFSMAPNPLNPHTTVRFALDRDGDATLNVFSVQGRLVRSISSVGLVPGAHSITWDGRNQGGATVSSGVYFVELSTPSGVARQRVVVAK